MKVILKEDIAKLGGIGEVISVADGYARNYLLPQGKAVLAHSRNLRRLEHEKLLIRQSQRKALTNAQSLAQRIESTSLTISRKVGAEDRLFGSVTTRDIEQALEHEGIEISHRAIKLEEPIRKLGVYQVMVRVHREVEVTLKLWVVADKEEEEGTRGGGDAGTRGEGEVEKEETGAAEEEISS